MFVFTPVTDTASAPHDFEMIQFARLKTHENRGDCQSTVVEPSKVAFWPKPPTRIPHTDQNHGPHAWQESLLLHSRGHRTD